MWICANDAFLSIVEPSPRDLDRAKIEYGLHTHLAVRARRAEHIRAVFPDAKIFVKGWEGRDYHARAFLPRAVVAAAIAERVLSIRYGNFKDSVKGRPLHDAYMRVWGVMLSLTPRRKNEPTFDWDDGWPKGRFDEVS